MYYRDHAPAHFHAIYGEYEIVVDIEAGLVSGRFPKRALEHVLEWYGMDKSELREDWQLLEQEKPLKRIAPLE